MARKKRVAKRTRKVQRKVSKSKRKVSKPENFRRSKSTDVKKKISLVINNLLLFVALSLVSFVLYRFLQNDILVNLFFVLATVFGFVSLAFLITLLILLIMKIVYKRRR